MQQIVQYQLAWHPQQGSQFRFRLDGVAQWSNWMRVSAADFCAVALIFNETPVYYNPQTDAIFTGEEPVGP
jgi:hypothetical protein